MYGTWNITVEKCRGNDVKKTFELQKNVNVEEQERENELKRGGNKSAITRQRIKCVPKIYRRRKNYN